MEDKIKTDDSRATMGFMSGDYAVVTFHRPVNVDSKPALTKVVEMVKDIARRMPLVFPVHPRTAKMLAETGLLERLKDNASVHISEPLPYIKFMNLVRGARVVVTDSGGVQEETTYLGIPCMTLRATTERPITITQGTNILCKIEGFADQLASVLNAPMPKRPVIKGWDGKAAQRTLEIISQSVTSNP